MIRRCSTRSDRFAVFCVEALLFQRALFRNYEDRAHQRRSGPPASSRQLSSTCSHRSRIKHECRLEAGGPRSAVLHSLRHSGRAGRDPESRGKRTALSPLDSGFIATRCPGMTRGRFSPGVEGASLLLVKEKVAAKRPDEVCQRRQDGAQAFKHR